MREGVGRDGRRELLLITNPSPSFPGVLTVIDPDDGAGIGLSVVLNYAFGFDFRIRHIAQGDTCEGMVSDLVRKGVFRAVPDRRYFERREKIIRYWDGHGWSTTPASPLQRTSLKTAVFLPTLPNE
jgi:hypothetical protein